MIFIPLFVEDADPVIRSLYPAAMFDARARDEFQSPIQEVKEDGRTMSMQLQLEQRLQDPCADLFSGKCAYCERAISRGEGKASYWRPAGYTYDPVTESIELGDYPWFQNEPRNVYFVCLACYGRQNNQFPTLEKLSERTDWETAQFHEKPLLLAPYEDDPAQHLNFLPNGKVETLDESPRGATTIEVFGLNRDDLVNERCKTLEEFKERLENRGSHHWLDEWLSPKHAFTGALWQAYREWCNE